IYVFWNKLRRSLGLADVRIHDLRHTFASFLVNAGHSLYEVQKLLGHSDPRTTMRYAHLGQASLMAAAETVSGFLSRFWRGDDGKKSVPPSLLKYGTSCGGNRASPSPCNGRRPKRQKKNRKDEKGGS
ncbi:MAG: site-specific integrase, partial [Bilophila wadsworthia]